MPPCWHFGFDRVRRYPACMATRTFKVQDVDVGHEYIEAYMMFIYYVEGMYEVAVNPASDRYPGGAAVPLEDR